MKLTGRDEKLVIQNDSPAFEDLEFGAPYAVPDDPNHTHYYVWRWYAQLSAGQNECIHHAIAGEQDNDIILGDIDEEDYIRASSYDRTANRFIVLIARKDEDDDPQNLTVSIPASIQPGARYNRDNLFTSEGFSEGEKVRVKWISEDIEPKTGYRKNLISDDSSIIEVTDGLLTFLIPETRRLTTLVFEAIKD